jgi:hypothetical protein
MKQRQAAPGRPARDGASSLGVDSKGEFPLVFGTIDCRIGSRVDDEVRGQLVKPTRDRSWLGKFEHGAIRGDHRVLGRKPGDQPPPTWPVTPVTRIRTGHPS